MGLDHSVTYKDGKIKNLPHRLRLKKIIEIIDGIENKDSYIDIGCSNGYITNVIHQQYQIDTVTGYDHCEQNLAVARESYPDISFRCIDLNLVFNNELQYDLVTCFETLEHVGNIDNALSNILNMRKNTGKLLISVPIEIGPIGILKFIAKTCIYKYSLSELNDLNERLFYWTYLWYLVRFYDISTFRKQRDGYGTHFGFDYRQIDIFLQNKKINYTRKKYSGTMFYLVT
jgi:SAM-dependent methyltransferase